MKKVELYLTPFQIKKYVEKNELRITPNAVNKPDKSNYSISVSQIDLNGIANVRNGSLSEYVIKTKDFKGGFIVPLLAGAAAISTIGKNIYDSIQNKKVNNELLNQKINQNKIISDHSTKGLPINVSQITPEDYSKTFGGAGVKVKAAKLPIKTATVKAPTVKAPVKAPKKKVEKLVDQFKKLKTKDQSVFLSTIKSTGGAITLSGKNITHL